MVCIQSAVASLPADRAEVNSRCNIAREICCITNYNVNEGIEVFEINLPFNET